MPIDMTTSGKVSVKQSFSESSADFYIYVAQIAECRKAIILHLFHGQLPVTSNVHINIMDINI